MNSSAGRLSPAKLFQERAEGALLDPKTPEGFKALVDLANQQFEFCCELDRECSKKSAEKSEAVKDWWLVASSLLLAFTRIKAQEDRFAEPFPWETLARLANISEELGHGIVPTFVQDVAAAGKARPFMRMERRAIGYALLYIEAAEAGEIDDRRAKSTVKEIYGVSAETVRNWMKRRDEMVCGIPSIHKAGYILEERMRGHGKTYCRYGRSTMKPASAFE